MIRLEYRATGPYGYIAPQTDADSTAPVGGNRRYKTKKIKNSNFITAKVVFEV